MTKAYDFDPEKYNVIMGGIIISDWISAAVEPLNDSFVDDSSAIGNVTRVHTNDRRATATLIVSQSSIVNDALSTLHIVDKATGGSVVPFFVKDLLGTTLISASKAWITKSAPATTSNGVETREWTIRLADTKIFIGGNFEL